ncbi:hypothetical protein J5N97_012264 [Dioscorea zingiberensis]|uniref:Uncharacterized protein n=1 Tax=Dioscorea zingiberensis TaxID=325984 RepID=A0A9D5CNT0_9LILI|nr:hypothetical protein J5N97_012264 [Dioscorea zingiberensis]
MDSLTISTTSVASSTSTNADDGCERGTSGLDIDKKIQALKKKTASDDTTQRFHQTWSHSSIASSIKIGNGIDENSSSLKHGPLQQLIKAFLGNDHSMKTKICNGNDESSSL